MSVYRIRLFGELTDPEDYLDMFDVLEDALPSDIIHFQISCVGGNVYTMQEFVQRLATTKATVVAQVNSLAMSAGLMIAARCHEFEVGPLASFMAHAVSCSGAEGIAKDIQQQANFDFKVDEETLKYCLSSLFTNMELERMLGGQTILVSSKGMKQRIGLRAAKRSN